MGMPITERAPVNYAAHRAKISAAIARRRQASLIDEDSEVTKCQHEFKRTEKTLPIERPDMGRAVETGTTYKRGRAYLVRLVCSKCQESRNIDYVVEG